MQKSFIKKVRVKVEKKNSIKNIPLDYSIINKIDTKDISEICKPIVKRPEYYIHTISNISKNVGIFDRKIKVNNNISRLVWEESHLNELEDLFDIFKRGCADLIPEIEENILTDKFSFFIRQCSSGELN
jgi:predicted transport protein